ncbi:hypothetical protein V6N13_055101 [Hibiscus sabdariffa]
MTLVNEPSLAVEQHYYSKQCDCVVIDFSRDCVNEPVEDENIGCRSSGYVDCRVGIKSEVPLVGSCLKELMNVECCENSICLKKNKG